MAITANGFIAKNNDDTSWISKEEWGSYSLAVRKAGCLIVGYRTYGILTKQSEFSEFENVKLAIVSEKDFQTLSPNHHVVYSPREALKFFDGHKEVVVAGGGMLNASFLAENLVDEVYLDVEPIVFGEGIPVFKGKDFEHSLKFIGQKKISDNEIQLHYKVIK